MPIGLKALTDLTHIRTESIRRCNDLGIEEWRPHAKQGSSQQNPLPRLKLCPNLRLPRKKGREIHTAIDRPERSLRPQRQQLRVVAIQHQASHRSPCSRVLRKPHTFASTEVEIRYRSIAPTSSQTNAPRQIHTILHN